MPSFIRFFVLVNHSRIVDPVKSGIDRGCRELGLISSFDVPVLGHLTGRGVPKSVPLSSLPGIGLEIAKNIITHREGLDTQNFCDPKDLMKAKNLGKKNYEKIQDMIHITA